LRTHSPVSEETAVNRVIVSDAAGLTPALCSITIGVNRQPLTNTICIATLSAYNNVRQHINHNDAKPMFLFRGGRLQ
jgi:phosphoserine aminotransferase